MASSSNRVSGLIGAGIALGTTELMAGVFQRVPSLIDAVGQTPTLADLLPYDGVLTWSNASFQDSIALGDVMADYVDAGGAVVVAVFGTTTTTANAPAAASRRRGSPSRSASACSYARWRASIPCPAATESRPPPRRATPTPTPTEYPVRPSRYPRYQNT